MKLSLVVLLLFPALHGRAADLRSELEVGRAYYQQGDFRKALVHLRRTLKTDAQDAEVNYWTGMAYQGLGDVAAPFGGRYNSRALAYLTKAVDLAPGRLDFRRELFGFLLDSGSASPAALRLAEEMLRRTSEIDPEYNSMRRRLDVERGISGSAAVRFDRLFLAIPRAGFRLSPR
jgi:tetratricopeptide (TPR) repeat protein